MSMLTNRRSKNSMSFDSAVRLKLRLRRTIIVAILPILLALLCPTAVPAQTRRPVQIEMSGYFEAPEEVRAMRRVSVQVGSGEPRNLAVTRIRTVGGGRTGSTLLSDFARFRPAFRFTGDSKMLERMSSAKPDQLVTVIGNLTQDRFVLVSRVDVASPGKSD
jgi:hypothetical protein